MKFSTVTAAALLPFAYGFTKDDYDSGRVMAKMMEAKEVGSPLKRNTLDLYLSVPSLLGPNTRLLVNMTTRSGTASKGSVPTRISSSARTGRLRL